MIWEIDGEAGRKSSDIIHHYADSDHPYKVWPLNMPDLQINCSFELIVIDLFGPLCKANRIDCFVNH